MKEEITKNIAKQSKTKVKLSRYRPEQAMGIR
jgi:hypothetical protein